MTPSAFHVPPRTVDGRSQGLRRRRRRGRAASARRRRRSRRTGCRATRRETSPPRCPPAAAPSSSPATAATGGTRHHPRPRRRSAGRRARAQTTSGWSVAGVTISTRVSGGAVAAFRADAAPWEWPARRSPSLRRRMRPSRPAVRVTPMTWLHAVVCGAAVSNAPSSARRTSRCRDPLLRILLQAARGQPAERAAAPSAAVAFQSGSLCEHARERVRDVLARRTLAAREHLEQHAPNAQMSARLSTGSAPRLLRAHVRGGAEDHARLRHRRRRDRRRLRHVRGAALRSGSIAFASPKSSTFTVPSGAP